MPIGLRGSGTFSYAHSPRPRWLSRPHAFRTDAPSLARVTVFSSLRSMKENAGEEEEVRELLYQALETELGGVQVYQTALRCAVNDDLKKEWEEYLEQTHNHVRSWRTSSRGSSWIPRRRRPGGWSSATSGSPS